MTATYLRRALRAILPSALLLATAASFAPAAAQDAASFYKGKTVKIIVGFGPGGGYDAYARFIAPQLEKAIGATVIVENQPGAGSLTSLNRLYTATPDGLQMTLANGTAAGLGQVLGRDNARYDLAKFEYYGIVSASPWLWLVRPDSEIKTPQDAQKLNRPITWAGSGPTDGLSDGGAVTCEALQLKCKLIIGYKGSSDAALSVFRGETDSVFVSDTSANNYVSSGQARAVANMSRDRSQYFKNLPTIFEMVKLSDEQAFWIDFRGALDKLGRVLLTTPGVPADRVAYMRGKIKAVLTEPTFVAEMNKKDRYVDYIDSDVAKKTAIGLVGDITPERRERIAHVLTKKYN